MTIIITETIKYSKLDSGGHRMIKLTCKNPEFVKLFGASIKLCDASRLFDFMSSVATRINNELNEECIFTIE